MEVYGHHLKVQMKHETPTSWMPLRSAKTYQKFISKCTIPLKMQIAVILLMFLIIFVIK